MESIRTSSRVVLHFHPDRLTAAGTTVIESLLRDGIYRNQFETGLSAGSRSAFAGGSRDRWERELFGGAYHDPTVLPADRPRYGVLEVVRFPDGPLPRFGSSYFVLRHELLSRCTFTFGGSEQRGAAARMGTIEYLWPVFAALLEEISAGGRTPVPWPPYQAPTLGLEHVSLCGFLDRLPRELSTERPDCVSARPGRVLDSAVEAQVHSVLHLAEDVELLVLDPSFRGSSTAEIAGEVAATYGFPLNWHCGYWLPADRVSDDFRGPRMPALAERVGRDGIIDASIIGAAERTLHIEPQLWEDWGTKDEVLQHLKQLWHVLVHFGNVIEDAAAR